MKRHAAIVGLFALVTACSSEGEVTPGSEPETDGSAQPTPDGGKRDAIGGGKSDATTGEHDATTGEHDATLPDDAEPSEDADVKSDAKVTDAKANDAKADAKVDAAPPPPPPPPTDLTFYVVADTHADPVESYDLRAIARVINTVGNGGSWPATIGGQQTGFTGGAIAKPKGVVFVGDLTGWGTAATEIPTFKRYFEKGNTNESIQFNGYLGLGNHDVDDADRGPTWGAQNRAAYWSWIESRHKGTNAPVPVERFDNGSHDYSWSFGRVHFVQTNRFVGDVQYGWPSGLPFLTSDLHDAASDGRPVFLFHHYGMDAFGTQDRWWTAADRTAYRNALKGYAISAIFVGHSHAAFNYSWEGIRVFQVNNAKAENGTGNNDGNGSFAIVRITDQKLDVVTCRWLDDQGHYELIAPFFSGPANPGRAQ